MGRVYLIVSVAYGAGVLGYYATMYSSLLSLYTYYFLPILYVAHGCLFVCIGAVRWRWGRVFFGSCVVGMAILFSVSYLTARIQLSDFVVPEKLTAKNQVIEKINNGLPASAVIGCWDAGEIGYKANKPVVNLDGLVNSYKYLETCKTHGLESYLDDVGIDYIVGEDVRRTRVDPELKWDLFWEVEDADVAQITMFTLSPESLLWAGQHTRKFFIYRRPVKLDVKGG
jgi:hypothetical protein